MLAVVGEEIVIPISTDVLSSGVDDFSDTTWFKCPVHVVVFPDIFSSEFLQHVMSLYFTFMSITTCDMYNLAVTNAGCKMTIKPLVNVGSLHLHLDLALESSPRLT